MGSSRSGRSTDAWHTTTPRRPKGLLGRASSRWNGRAFAPGSAQKIVEHIDRLGSLAAPRARRSLPAILDQAVFNASIGAVVIDPLAPARSSLSVVTNASPCSCVKARHSASSLAQPSSLGHRPGSAAQHGIAEKPRLDRPDALEKIEGGIRRELDLAGPPGAAPTASASEEVSARAARARRGPRSRRARAACTASLSTTMISSSERDATDLTIESGAVTETRSWARRAAARRCGGRARGGRVRRRERARPAPRARALARRSRARGRARRGRRPRGRGRHGAPARPARAARDPRRRVPLGPGARRRVQRARGGARAPRRPLGCRLAERRDGRAARRSASGCG